MPDQPEPGEGSGKRRAREEEGREGEGREGKDEEVQIEKNHRQSDRQSEKGTNTQTLAAGTRRRLRRPG
eukprot:507328-Hanusia_phi.AAC.1